MLTQSALKELLHYDPDTGLFTWLVRKSSRAPVGSIARFVDKILGYVVIKIDGKKYRAHRLAWLYMHGTLPPEQLDHINRDRADNRLSNLRLATNAENQQNKSLSSKNTSGHVGVHWYKRTQKWRAQIQVNNKNIYLGYFSDLSEAIAARKAAEQKYHQFNQPVAA